MKTPYLSWEKQTIFITLWYALLSIAYCVFFMVKWLWNILFSLFTQNKCSICSPPIDSFICFSIFIGKQANPCVFHIHEFCRAKKKKKITVIMTYFFCVKANGVFALQKCVKFGCGLMSAWLCADSIVYHWRQHILSEMSVWNLSISPNMKINQYVFLFYLQEVGSIIGKKGEIVNRFREEVRKISI